MRISLKKTSLVDFPGRLSAVFFFSGCNLRCPWCQNRELATGEGTEEFVDAGKALDLIKRRRSVLGGVVLSGGEPLVQKELPSLVKEIKALGFPVKIDTNGTIPDMLDLLFQKKETRPDYVALDLKLAPGRYKEIGNEKSGEDLAKSAALLRSSGVPCEYRSLVLPNEYFTEADIAALAPFADNCNPWNFRPFAPGNCLDSAWDGFEKPRPEVVESLVQKARSLGKNAFFPQAQPASPL